MGGPATFTRGPPAGVLRCAQLVQKQAISDARLDIPGGSAGHTVSPVEKAGCYAPGGRYPLPSSIIMTVVTARVAGCDQVWAASPRPNDVTMGAAFIAGADALLAVGGAHAITAMAYGCGAVGPVDCVVGPGNQYVVAAKSLIAGRVAIDMLAGPSECLVLADDTADPAVVAADLLAQAEHDPQALPSLVSTSEALVNAVEEALAKQLADLPTADIAREACKNGYAVVVDSTDEAVAISNRLAPEHLEIHMEDAEAISAKCQHYGGVFVGHAAAEVLGDYGAGPNHTLPTGGTARSTGGLSVFTFLRIRTWLNLSHPKTAADLVHDAHRLATLEGLHGHARAASMRLDEEGKGALHTGEEPLPLTGSLSMNLVPPNIRSDGSDENGKGNMLLALPKKGRLAEECMKFVEAAGLKYHRRDRLDVAPCSNMPITLVFLPAKDIASFVGMGNVDVGITGQDMVAEAGCTVTTELELGIGKCALSLQVPDAQKHRTAADFSGARIATSFPNLTRQFFEPLDKAHGWRPVPARHGARPPRGLTPPLPPAGAGCTTQIATISGSVEAAVGLGLADAVVDLVETGTTMRAAGLTVCEDLMKTQVHPAEAPVRPRSRSAPSLPVARQAVLISNPNTTHAGLVRKICQRFEGYLTSTKYALMSYNVPRTLLDKAVVITPGKRSPTVQALEEDSWVAVSVMVENKQASEVMDKLKDLGATDILLVNLINCRS